MLVMYREFDMQRSRANYRVYCHKSINTYSEEELVKNFSGWEYLRLTLSTTDMVTRDLTDERPKANPKLGAVVLRYLHLGDMVDSITAADIKVIVNYYDIKGKVTHTDCIKVPFATREGDNYGYCNIFKLRKGDAKASVVIFDDNSSDAIELLIVIAEEIADPLWDLIKANTPLAIVDVSALVLNAFEKIQNDQVKVTRSSSNPLKRAIALAKKATEPKVVGVFEVDFVKLLNEKPDDKGLITIMTGSSDIMKVKLWWKK